MKLVLFAVIATSRIATSHPNLPPRSVGGSCSTPDGSGTCQHTSDCKGWSIPGPLPGYCPNDPDDVQCCVQKTCSPPGQTGICQNTSKPCPGGQYNGGNFCPGDDSIQCCPTGSSSSKTTPQSGGNSDGVGQACHPPGQTGICKKMTESTCAAGFNSGNYCPGDETVQCCPDSSASAPATSTAVAPPPVNTCAHPVRDTCTFYPDCLESKYNCGPDGYPIGYGLNYCQRFTAAKPRMDSAGKKWVSDTMLCLQTALVPYATTETTTCPALKDTAFASHPDCYVNSGVCTLGPKDWEVIITTVSLKDLFGGIDNLKAVLQTLGDCAEFYAWLIEQGVIVVLHKIEDEGKDIWHKLTDWL